MAGRIPPAQAWLSSLLRDRRRYALAELAPRIGQPAEVLRRHAAADEALLAEDAVRWSTAVRWVVESLPLRTLLDTLGPDAGLIPVGLHPLPVQSSQPGYLVHALQVQWQIEQMSHRIARPATFEDYLADLLHRAIGPDTVDALRSDEEFMRAYAFPEDSDD